MKDEQVKSPVGDVDDLVIWKFAEYACCDYGGEHDDNSCKELPARCEVAEKVPQQEGVYGCEEREQRNDRLRKSTFRILKDWFGKSKTKNQDHDLYDHDVAIVFRLLLLQLVAREQAFQGEIQHSGGVRLLN